MTLETREKVRRLQNKLCAMAVEYKGVKPQACADCESPCGYGMELLDALGMERPKGEQPEACEKVPFSHDRRMRRILRAMNRRRRG